MDVFTYSSQIARIWTAEHDQLKVHGGCYVSHLRLLALPSVCQPHGGISATTSAVAVDPNSSPEFDHPGQLDAAARTSRYLRLAEVMLRGHAGNLDRRVSGGAFSEEASGTCPAYMCESTRCALLARAVNVWKLHLRILYSLIR